MLILYLSLIADIRVLLQKEDKLRTKFYKEENERENKKNFVSYEAWLKSLKIKVKFEKVDSENKLRVL